MALALYRRYRPDTFAGVIGQDQVTVPLMRALDEGKLTHAYLFSGPRGCGKTSSARILARCVNCAKGPTSHPCGECESCKDLATGGPGSIDVVEIDAASHNGVDDARELRERAGFAPARDRYKIFILDEAHMVTPQGFNALLKIVEEPPEHVMFIFATTEPDKVIGTIRSRTHHYPFRLVPAEVMGPYLEQICEKEHITAEPGVLKLAMRAGGGSVRDTLSVLDQLMVGAVDGVITHDASVALLGFTPEALIGEAIDAVIDASGGNLYGVIQKVVVGGFDPRRFVEDLLARVRDLLVLTLAGDRAETVLSDTAEVEDMDDLHRQAVALGLSQLTAMADIINATLGQMTGAISPRMRLELLAARLLAGRENGFAAPVASVGAPGAGMPGASATSGSGAGTSVSGSGTASGTTGARGGFAGATSGSRGGGFAGAARNQHHDAADGQSQDSGRSTASTSQAAGSGFAGSARNQHPETGSVVVQGATTGTPGRSSSGVTGAETTTAQPAAQPSAPVQSSATVQPSAPAQPDNRTPDQKWDAMLSSLPEDVRRYVARDRARIKFVPTYAKTGRPRVWLRFDTALNKYAFALAVASEPVDGTNKVVSIVRAEVRKLFGPQADLAPTPTTDDGQKTPPFSKLSQGEQQKIKAQLLQENLQAAAAKAQSGETNAGGAKEGAREQSAASSAPDQAEDDDSHRGAASGPASPGTSARTASVNDDPWAQPATTSRDDDPWAHPLPKQGGSSAAQEPEHHRKQVAVPDLSDDTDPWAQPAPAATNDRRARSAAASDSADPWNTPLPANGGFANGGRSAPVMGQNGGQPAVRDPGASNGPAEPVEPDDPWKDVPPPAEPDDPWNASMPARNAGGMGNGSAASPQSGMPGMSGVQSGQDGRANDPWNTPPVQSAGSAKPQVDADDDEYSMDDESLGSAVAMNRDELRRLFEVKKVETFAADDPRNPRNMHAAPKHDE
ncbi:DNA polymerase III subunit gamma and tau [Bifidobacterium stellenboschense]|uniref:DNA-directed DNA polymerase n=1 Tax=Bifidobacterium stellenboschense TaxID=762211 RepID=A0A087DN96_9BIFI|nr:DNA polymerase III subunit gamma and tau [Bifidobacterium stellenboschense]KFI96996.1 DNA polymerase III, subunit gamma and tau [Bifidobacterium stellenboschense]